MSDNPFVTIITPTYMRFTHIFRTIQSVLDQDYSNIEYIITDDGSANFPESDIREYIEKNKKDNIKKYKIIHNEKNLGTVKNLNNAYKSAGGIYYINISGDDVFYDNCVVSRIIEKFISSDCDVIVASRIGVDENDKPVMLLPHYTEREKIMKWDSGRKQYYAFIRGMYYDMASGSIMYYSKRILEKLNYFDENYRLWEDGPMIAKYTWIGKLNCFYEILAIRYTLDGISANAGKPSPSRRCLLLDAEKFCEKEVCEHYDELPRTIQREVVLSQKWITAGSLKDRILLCLKNPDIALKHAMYKFEREINRYLDKFFLIKMGVR